MYFIIQKYWISSRQIFITISIVTDKLFVLLKLSRGLVNNISVFCHNKYRQMNKAGNLRKVVIIGSGPGGYHAAINLAKLNCEVTIVEKNLIGGTCLNVGCIPTKVLLDYLSLFEHFKESAQKKKLFSGANDIDVCHEALKSYQRDVIKQLQQGLEKLFSKNKIKYICGEAKLLQNKKVSITVASENIDLGADEIIIATGSKPRSIPGFAFDKDLIVSSDHIWNIPRIPKRLLIIGSGPIGIEFARVYNTLGSKVIISEIQEKICPILDNELSENLVRSLKRRGIIVKPNYASKLIQKNAESVLVEFISTENNHKEQSEFDQVLIAVGREPNITGLGLDSLNIEMEQGVFIKVSKYLQTSMPNLWAVGDVTNYPQLAHTASFQARVVAQNISKDISGQKIAFNGDIIPGCIFGYPEVAFVGQKEEELKEKSVNYRAGKFLFLASGKAKASGLTEGLVKVLMDVNTQKILGAHIIGPEASNLIHEIVIAMQNNLTVKQLTESIHAHPTYSEVVLEALEDCLGESVYV